MNKENASKLWKIIQEAGDYLVHQRNNLENPDNTFTSLPRNITPAGMELDPDTGVDLSNTKD